MESTIRFIVRKVMPTASLIVLIVAAAAICGGLLQVGGCGPDRSTATKGYWQKLHAAGGRLQTAQSSPTEPHSQRIARIAQMKSALQSTAGAVRELSTDGVDPDVLSFVGRLVNHLDTGSGLLERLGRHLEEMERLRVDSTSIETLAESFVRGFLGDVTGKAREINAAATELDKRSQELHREFVRFDEVSQALVREEVTLRASLRTRYGSDFETLNLRGSAN